MGCKRFAAAFSGAVLVTFAVAVPAYAAPYAMGGSAGHAFGTAGQFAQVRPPHPVFGDPGGPKLQYGPTGPCVAADTSLQPCDEPNVEFFHGTGTDPQHGVWEFSSGEQCLALDGVRPCDGQADQEWQAISPNSSHQPPYGFVNESDIVNGSAMSHCMHVVDNGSWASAYCNGEDYIWYLLDQANRHVSAFR